MPIFEYKGINAQGKQVNGIVESENEKGGRSKLRRGGVYVTDIYLEGTKGGFSLFGKSKGIPFLKRVKTKELAHCTRQLATLLGSGVPLVEALTAMQEQVENPILKKSISQIKEKVVEGTRLADAMREHPKIYNKLYLSMVEAGEASGNLELVLARLADFTEYQAMLKGKILGAMTYPLIMALVGFGLMIYLLSSVVPDIVVIFEDAKAALPLPTRILIGLSNFMQDYWWVVLIVTALGIWLMFRYAKTPKGRHRIDGLSLKAPIFGELFRKVAISRFSRTMSTLLNSGVQLLPALDNVKNVVNNVVLSEAIESTRTSVKEGESIAEPLNKSRQFPPLVIHMIKVGEKTGNLEAMLEKVADSYDNEVDTTVNSLATLLEPLIIIIMGGIVTFVVLSILLPILDMTKLQ